MTNSSTTETNEILSVGQQKLVFSPTLEKQSEPKICKLSYDKGKRMLRKTLANHVKPQFWTLLSENGYMFCPTTSCPVVYFNNESDYYLGLDEVHSSVMHKMEIQTENRPMCYCKNVLESQILDELLVKQCCDSIKDIQDFTGANGGMDCAITNPSGRCCGAQIKEVLDWAKERRLNISSPLLDEAISCCSKIAENAIDQD